MVFEKVLAIMIDGFEDVRELKERAKGARDDGDWVRAIRHLDQARDLLGRRLLPEQRRVPDSSAQVRSRPESDLADICGLIGGVQRRWGLTLEGNDRKEHLRKSIDAYKNGFDYEKNLGVADASTYNRVNLLVGRVLLHLLDPDAPEDADKTDIENDLREAEEILKEQLSSVRQRDPWAYLDLATIRLLRGTSDALFVYNDLDRLRPPAFVYESAFATLEPLAEAASGRLRADLDQAIAQLRRSGRFAR